jgi:hypothetical protein
MGAIPFAMSPEPNPTAHREALGHVVQSDRDRKE